LEQTAKEFLSHTNPGTSGPSALVFLFQGGHYAFSVSNAISDLKPRFAE
jgi:hypothetical protein